jgi:acyl-CoA synthetase (AMP-forming)/AMP-acid ligase II
MTETSPVSTKTRADDSLDRRVSTVGRVHPHVEVKIVNSATGETLPRGEPGELCTRGYSVMLGYWNEPKKTAEERRLEEVRARISQIDRQIAEFDRRRSEIVRERNDLINEFLQMADITNMDYEHRELLYDMLNRPNWSAEDISKKLGFNETLVSRMIDDILQYCRNMER